MTMLSINTNVGALFAAHSSYKVNKSMETSMARLSSGKRINSASDDAAGIQIANRMDGEIRGLNQAVRNAADAQALLMTAEGALDEVHTILLRIRELSVQASNGTYTAQDRVALQAEVTDLQSEITRISRDTTWNGKTLLDSTLTNGISFQIGADTGQDVTVAIAGVAPANLSLGGAQLTTAAGAKSYITKIDAAISIISTNRGTYAAAINRLDHAIANMQNISTNLSMSKGRIEDADFAAAPRLYGHITGPKLSSGRQSSGREYGTSLVMSADGQRIATAGTMDAVVYEWSSNTNRWVQMGSTLEGGAYSITMDASGYTVALGDYSHACADGNNCGKVTFYKWDAGASDWTIEKIYYRGRGKQAAWKAINLHSA